MATIPVRALAGFLTDYGVDAELEHFRTVRFRKPLNREAAFHISRIIDAAPDNLKAQSLARRALAAVARR